MCKISIPTLEVTLIEGTSSLQLHLKRHALGKCTTLWAKPEQVHNQNMEQFCAHDCHQNMAQPQTTQTVETMTRGQLKHLAGMMVTHDTGTAHHAYALQDVCRLLGQTKVLTPSFLAYTSPYTVYMYNH